MKVQPRYSIIKAFLPLVLACGSKHTVERIIYGNLPHSKVSLLFRKTFSFQFLGRIQRTRNVQDAIPCPTLWLPAEKVYFDFLKPQSEEEAQPGKHWVRPLFSS